MAGQFLPIVFGCLLSGVQFGSCVVFANYDSVAVGCTIYGFDYL
jgi:hypothetical protein